ncbi:MAG: hypothetical protein PHE26_13615, partial [Syntrophomonadaceae bacterium]|nr:hypothetical protein [Syntrophomonadaceae bacterium]
LSFSHPEIFIPGLSFLLASLVLTDFFCLDSSRALVFLFGFIKSFAFRLPSDAQELYYHAP